MSRECWEERCVDVFVSGEVQTDESPADWTAAFWGQIQNLNPVGMGRFPQVKIGAIPLAKKNLGRTLDVASSEPLWWFWIRPPWPCPLVSRPAHCHDTGSPPHTNIYFDCVQANLSLYVVSCTDLLIVFQSDKKLQCRVSMIRFLDLETPPRSKWLHQHQRPS